MRTATDYYVSPVSIGADAAPTGTAWSEQAISTDTCQPQSAREKSRLAAREQATSRRGKRSTAWWWRR